MSSALKLTGAARPAFTCHTISPREKTIPIAAAIQALVVEFKTKIFLSIAFRVPTLVGGLLDNKSPTKVGTLNAVIQTKVLSEPIRVVLRWSMMDEQKPQG